MQRNINAVFLDRDGTINVDTNYPHNRADFSFFHGAKEGLRMLSQAGFKLIIVTNQSGIARGMYTEEDYHKLMKWLYGDLKKSQIEISADYFCPHHPGGKIEKYRIECDCRKPNIGLFKRAIADFDIDESQSWAIGDRMRDLAICSQSSVRGVLLYNKNEERQKSIWKIKGGLKEAAEKIINGDFV